MTSSAFWLSVGLLALFWRITEMHYSFRRAQTFLLPAGVFHFRDFKVYAISVGHDWNLKGSFAASRPTLYHFNVGRVCK